MMSSSRKEVSYHLSNLKFVSAQCQHQSILISFLQLLPSKTGKGKKDSQEV